MSSEKSINTEEAPLAPLLEALRALSSWLEKADVQGMIIEGVAASILGRPRLTRDIDAVILMESAISASLFRLLRI